MRKNVLQLDGEKNPKVRKLSVFMEINQQFL